jgi:hypothetical protein
LGSHDTVGKYRRGGIVQRLPSIGRFLVFGGDGTALERDMLGELRHKGTLKATIYGMILEVTIDSLEFVLQGGKLQHEYHVQYPIAMDQDSEYLYVASVISEDVTENKLYEPFTPQDYRYGSAFSVKMQ